MRALAAVLALTASLGAAGGENSDLEFIPRAKKTTETASRATGSAYRFVLEQSGTVWSNRGSLAVPVPQALPNHQSLTSLDLRSTFKVRRDLELHLSDRLNYLYQDDAAAPNRGSVRNDLREAYASLELSPRFFVEAGRVNLRKGVALGFNPTDFFKARTAVVQSSLDPSAARENRLGVLLVQAQGIFEQVSASFAAAPAVQAAASQSSTASAAIDPRFDLTNHSSRALATIGFEAFDLSPQALYFHDEYGDHIGANLSHVIGKSVVTYLEWAGVRQDNLATRAVQFGKSTSTLPASAPLAPLNNGGAEFQNDLSAGFSWTSSAKYTLNLEYHYHQAGLSRAEFDRWISWGRQTPALAGELWYIRQYAMDRGEPFLQEEVFLRLEIPDFARNRHTLGAVAFINPYDGSTLAQLSSQYLASDRWTFAGYLTGLFGGATSEKGSLPYANSASAKISYYF